MTDRMITGMLGEGVLVRRHAAVFVLGAAPLSRRGIAYAALRAGGDDAVLSHRTAAWWRLLLPAFPGRIDVAVPRSRRGDPDLIRWHKPARLAPEDWEEHEGLRVTRVARTLLDLADDQPERLPKAVANAEFHRLLDVHEIQGAIGRASGHHGIRALRRALARPLPQLADAQ